ncbi:3'-5' exonuclease [Janibacter limosus]|uniref:3'-5' exonuclease n=1 Tax=Janibacter limosus TaxID=53458 RepID=A0AC61U7L9_9MICO|nr:3'-5' exonuclease [Janibacter limosus]UUZ45944.1 3'-5' exonuclease [Janibacter limosus]
MSGYTVIDVETTGLSPERLDRVVEIGVVYVSDDGDIRDQWSTLVNPGRDVGPTRIHGISATDVLHAPRFEDLAPYVLRAVAGRTIVAHNAPFDLRFLAHELRRAGLGNADKPSALCTMQWSTAYLDAPSRRLIDCCHASGITLDDAHSALADATATAQLLGHYLQLSDRRPPRGEVLRASRSHVWPTFAGAYPAIGMVARTSRPDAARDPWMGSVVSHMPRAADVRTDSYLAVLETALLDGVLDQHEQEALIGVALETGLTRRDVLQIHRQYVVDMAKVATLDHVVTREEHDELVLHDTAARSHAGGPGSGTRNCMAGISIGRGRPRRGVHDRHHPPARRPGLLHRRHED